MPDAARGAEMSSSDTLTGRELTAEWIAMSHPVIEVWPAFVEQIRPGRTGRV